MDLVDNSIHADAHEALRHELALFEHDKDPRRLLRAYGIARSIQRPIPGVVLDWLDTAFTDIVASDYDEKKVARAFGLASIQKSGSAERRRRIEGARANLFSTFDALVALGIHGDDAARIVMDRKENLVGRLHKEKSSGVDWSDHTLIERRKADPRKTNTEALLNGTPQKLQSVLIPLGAGWLTSDLEKMIKPEYRKRFSRVLSSFKKR